MTPDDKKAEENNETQNGQEANGQENKKETSDAKLLLDSEEKMKKVGVSHQNFSEAAKTETKLAELEKKTESDATDTSNSNEKSSDGE